MTNLRVLLAELPGAGEQWPTTQCVEFPEVYVIAARGKALLLRFPILKGREEWIARSQMCGAAADGTVPDLDRHSQIGDFGTARIPLYIVKKWNVIKKTLPTRK